MLTKTMVTYNMAVSDTVSDMVTYIMTKTRHGYTRPSNRCERDGIFLVLALLILLTSVAPAATSKSCFLAFALTYDKIR